MWGPGGGNVPRRAEDATGGQGAKGESWRRQCGYPNGTPLIDTNCSEPINLQIGLSDLVSVLDSFKGLGRLDNAGGWYKEMGTECLAFGVPVRDGAGNASLAPGPLAVAGQRGLPRGRRLWLRDNL